MATAAPHTTPEYVVLVHRSGKVWIAKDYGDYAWNGPVLSAVGFHKTRKWARLHANAIRDRMMVKRCEIDFRSIVNLRVTA